MSVEGFKGFDKELKCRGFKYEMAKEYEEYDVEIGTKGFHFCEYPLDVFGYYPPTNSRYCKVKGEGKIDRIKYDSESVVACTKLRIGAELGLSGIISAGIKFITDKVQWNIAKEPDTDNRSVAVNTRDNSVATNTSNRSIAISTGEWSVATNVGNRSAATNVSNRSVATNTGYWSVATNTGKQSVATNTGYRSTAIDTGDGSVATNVGNRSVATNTGDGSIATNTGADSVATNTGDGSAATNTGNWSVAANTGLLSMATNTGDRSIATNTGYRSVAVNTGDRSVAINVSSWSEASVEGSESIAIAIGWGSKAKGAIGCWIALAEWVEVNDECHISNVQLAKVDGEKIKADTFYRLIDGDFVEVR